MLCEFIFLYRLELRAESYPLQKKKKKIKIAMSSISAMAKSQEAAII